MQTGRELPTCSLEFPKSQARVLQATADRLKRAGASREDVQLFEQAAYAAKLGRPLIVRGNLDQAEKVADGFARAGIKRPTVSGNS